MRANLLPRERRQLSLFGATLEVDHLRLGAVLVIIALSSFAFVTALQWWRAESLRRAATGIEATLDRNDRTRRQLASLAREVALLQQIERESEGARHSGNDVAAELAQLGNAAPNGVWFEAVSTASEGYLLSGGGRNLDAVAETLAALTQLSGSATLVHFEDASVDDRVRFTLALKAGAVVHR